MNNAIPTTEVKNPQEMNLQELAQYFHLPINDAASAIGVCATVLKKICRKNGIDRWPHRKIKSLETMIEALEQHLPSHPELQDDVSRLREKREHLMQNPNATFKSLVSKTYTNSFNARLSKTPMPHSSPLYPKPTPTPSTL